MDFLHQPTAGPRILPGKLDDIKGLKRNYVVHLLNIINICGLKWCLKPKWRQAIGRPIAKRLNECLRKNYSSKPNLQFISLIIAFLIFMRSRTLKFNEGHLSGNGFSNPSSNRLNFEK